MINIGSNATVLLSVSGSLFFRCGQLTWRNLYLLRKYLGESDICEHFTTTSHMP